MPTNDNFPVPTNSNPVYFIGAGPGAADLISVRGQRLLQACDCCLYAGSLVAPEMLDWLPKSAMRIDSASLTLDQIIEHLVKRWAKGQRLVRLHSGDPSIYGAIGEQMRQLTALKVPTVTVPGVPAFTAAAASLQCELTLPDLTQTVIITRHGSKATAVPEREHLQYLASTQATLAIHLSIRFLKSICAILAPHYGDDCPVAVCYRVSWPDEKIIQARLNTVCMAVRQAKITRTALIIVSRTLNDEGLKKAKDSALYRDDHRHLFRHKNS